MTAADTSQQADRCIVVSADGHAGPPVPSYRRYLAARYLRDFDDYAARVDEFDRRLAERDQPSPAAVTRGNVKASLNGNQFAPLWDPAERLAQSERDGIAAEVIFPQGSIPFHVYPATSAVPGLGEVRSSVGAAALKAGIRAYNEWLAEFCGADRGRRAGVGIVSVGDVSAAVEEASWIHAAGLLGGISLPVVSPDRPGYNDPRYDPLWETCEALGLALNVHGGGMRTPFYGSGQDARALRLCETDWYMRRTLWFMIFGGVFDRFPGLKLIFTEQRTHWMGPLLRELDSIYETPFAAAAEYLPRKPSEYVRQNVYLGASFLSRSEATDRTGVGVDRLMWGADYPHPEGTWPFTRDSMRMTFAGLPADEVLMMLGGNAIGCYGLDEGLLRRVADRIGPTLEELNEPLAARPPASELSWGFRAHGPWS